MNRFETLSHAVSMYIPFSALFHAVLALVLDIFFSILSSVTGYACTGLLVCCRWTFS